MPVVRGEVELILEDEKGYTMYVGGRSYRAVGVKKPYYIREGDTVALEYEPRVLEGGRVLDVVAKPPVKMRVVERVPRVETELLEGIYTSTRELREMRSGIFSSLCSLYAGSGKSVEEILQAVKKVEELLFKIS
jgi:hypothetical protein